VTRAIANQNKLRSPPSRRKASRQP
jgi:hypothetical protein